ncbi:hypothetical protein [Halorussus sp. AFM4]|uniref:hypothetical protein n=1 Tax=Halorussus sp. AFM4 TaxID=3421651 RepID=UPI003EB986CB
MSAKSESVSIEQQTQFTTDGSLEVKEENVGTTLDQWGVDVDHRERPTRIDRPEASEFGVDDRPNIQKGGESGEQANLFADTAEDQRTLDGEDAQDQFQFDQRQASD